MLELPEIMNTYKTNEIIETNKKVKNIKNTLLQIPQLGVSQPSSVWIQRNLEECILNFMNFMNFMNVLSLLNYFFGFIGVDHFWELQNDQNL